MNLRGMISATARGAAGAFLTQIGAEPESAPHRCGDEIDRDGFDLFKKCLFDQKFDSSILEYLIVRC
jgi:hypothetical protein